MIRLALTWRSEMADKSLQIKLFLLERTATAYPDEWAKVVVAAVSEKVARELANQESKSEGYVWTDGSLVEAKELGVAIDGVDGVVLFSKE